MPDRQNFETVTPDAVVHPVANALDMEAPHARRTGLFDRAADARLLKQQLGDVLQLFANSAWCRRPVRCLPLNDTLNIARCATGDVQLEFQRYS